MLHCIRFYLSFFLKYNTIMRNSNSKGTFSLIQKDKLTRKHRIVEINPNKHEELPIHPVHQVITVLKLLHLLEKEKEGRCLQDQLARSPTIWKWTWQKVRYSKPNKDFSYWRKRWHELEWVVKKVTAIQKKLMKIQISIL